MKALQVKILGVGCAKCKALEAETRKAIEALGLEADIRHVSDFVEIARYGVMSTPALVVNDKLLSFGKVLRQSEIEKLLKD